MLDTTTLLIDDHLLADAINSAAPSGEEWHSAVAHITAPSQLAALSIIAALKHIDDSHKTLLAHLDNDALAGKAIAWALGQLATTENGVEADLIAAINAGSLDIRENGYVALAGLAARGIASDHLVAAMEARVQAEIERAKSGGSGLGEHACRVLGVLGASSTTSLIQQVIDQDRFCDRFELQRLRKSVSDNGRDQDSIKLITGNWTEYFADYLYVAPASVPTKPTAPPPTSAAKNTPPPPVNTAQNQADQQNADGSENDGAEAESDGAETESDGAFPLPIDWVSFNESAEVAALAEPLRPLAGQLGPLLEQLALRAVRAPLSDLNGQEFVALLLQVLPQALPPQHVQMALSPEALTCYKAIIGFLERTGVVVSGKELFAGLKMVREALTAQIRQAGILNGPDYSDPDEQSHDQQPGQPHKD